jgi:HEAT repeat protein
MDPVPVLSLDSLNSTALLLTLFGSIALLIVFGYQTGLLGKLLRAVAIVIQKTIETGFTVWKQTLSWASWPLFLGLVVALHCLAWYDGENPYRALLCGLALLFVGVVACLAYIFIDLERVEVGRGYKVLHNPIKGQELAYNLVLYGQRVGIPLMAIATLATVSGFAFLNQGLFSTVGRDWYTLSPRSAHFVAVTAEQRQPEYPDFLAFTLIHLSHVVDVLDVANSYGYARVTYVRQGRWPAATFLLLFKSFFTLVLLQQIFAGVRRFKMLREIIEDYWSPHQPIHERAGFALASFGVHAVKPLLSSLRSIDSLTSSQRSEIAAIVADIGPTTIPILVKYLNNPEEAMRAVAVNALGRLHALEALKPLIKTARDSSEMVRQSLVEAMGIIASPGTRTIRKRWLIRHSLRVSKRWFGTLLRLKKWLQPDVEEHPVHLVTGALRLLLADSITEVRLKAAQTLAQFGGEATGAVPELIHLLRDPEEAVRAQAAETLGKMGGPSQECVAALQKLLEDPSVEVRLTAIRTLGLLGSGAEETVLWLSLLLQDSDQTVRQAAAEAIRQIGSVPLEAVPELTRGLASEDNLVRAQTAEALGLIGSPAAAAVPALISVLQDDNDRVRARATEALGKMGSAAADAVPTIIRMLADEDNHINALAAEALGEISAAAAVAVPALIQALEHVNAEVRSQAAGALGKLKNPTSGAVSALERASRDGSGHERSQALLALVALGAPDERVFPAIRTALPDPDPEVRTAAVLALARHGKTTDELVAALLIALHDASDQVQIEATRTLPALVGCTPALVDGLRRLLEEDAVAVQMSAAMALGNLGRGAAVAGETLLHAFQTGETAVREQILQAFAKIQPPEALPAFKAGLTDPDPSIRKMASAGLIEAGRLPEDVFPVLIDALKDPENRVKANAARVLAQQLAIPAEAIPLLLDCTVNLDDTVRLYAFQALKAAAANKHQEVSQRLIHDSSLHVRLEAAHCILSDDPTNHLAAAVVLEALAGSVPTLHTRAVELLLSLGSNASAFRDHLVREAPQEQKGELTAMLAALTDDQTQAQKGNEICNRDCSMCVTVFPTNL